MSTNTQSMTTLATAAANQLQTAAANSSASSVTSAAMLAKRRNNKFSKLYPFVAETYREIRKYLSSISNDMNSQILIRIINKFKRGCYEIYDNILEDFEMSKLLAGNIIRVLDLLKDMSRKCNDLEEFQHRVCELIAIFISCELRVSLDCQEKEQLLDNRIVYIMRRHLVQEDEEDTRYNILRTLIYIPRLFNASAIMCAIFEEFIPLKPPTEVQKLPDKLYMLYIIIFYRWMKMQKDDCDQQFIVNFAASFMKPNVTLPTNPLYCRHLPKYTQHSEATRTILKQLIFYKDLRNACIIDNAFKMTGTILDLCDYDDDVMMTSPVQESPTSSDMMNFVELFSTVQLELRKPPNTSQVKHETQTIVDSVDLTVEEENADLNGEERLRHLYEKQERWLDHLGTITKQYLLLKNKQQQNKESSADIICLDSDSSGDDDEDKNESSQRDVDQNQDLFDDTYPETITPLNRTDDNNSESSENETTTKELNAISNDNSNNSLRTYVAKKSSCCSLSSADDESQYRLIQQTTSVTRKSSPVKKLPPRRNSIHINAIPKSPSPPPPSPSTPPNNEETDNERSSEDGVEYYTNFFYSSPSSSHSNMNSSGPGVPFHRLNSTFGTTGGKVIFSQTRASSNGSSSMTKCDERHPSPAKSEHQQHRTKKVHFDSSPMGPTAAYSKQDLTNKSCFPPATNTSNDDGGDADDMKDECFVPFWQRQSFQFSPSRLNAINMPSLVRQHQEQQGHRAAGGNTLFGNIPERRPSISSRMPGIGSIPFSSMPLNFSSGKRSLHQSRLATALAEGGHRCRKSLQKLNRLMLRRSTVCGHNDFNSYLSATTQPIQNEPATTRLRPNPPLEDYTTWSERSSYQHFLRNEISDHLDVASTGTWCDDKFGVGSGGRQTREELLESERQRNIMYNVILQKQRRKLELRALEKMKEKQRRKQEKQQKREHFQIEQSETMKQLERMNLSCSVTEANDKAGLAEEPTKQKKQSEVMNKKPQPSPKKRSWDSLANTEVPRPDDYENRLQKQQSLSKATTAEKHAFEVPVNPPKSQTVISDNGKESSDLDNAPLVQTTTRSRRSSNSKELRVSSSPDKSSAITGKANTRRSTRPQRRRSTTNHDLEQTTDSEFEMPRPLRERRKSQSAPKRRVVSKELLTTDSEMDTKSTSSTYGLRHSARLANNQATKCQRQSDSESVVDVSNQQSSSFSSTNMSPPTETGVKRKPRKSPVKKKNSNKECAKEQDLPKTNEPLEPMNSGQMSLEQNIVAVIAQRLSSPDTTTTTSILNKPMETAEHEEILDTLQDLLAAKEQGDTKSLEQEQGLINSNEEICNNPQMAPPPDGDIHCVLENIVINEIQREMDAQTVCPNVEANQNSQWNIRKKTIMDFEDAMEEDQVPPLIISKVQSYAAVQDFECPIETTLNSEINKAVVTENIVLRPQHSLQTAENSSMALPVQDLIMNLNGIPLLPIDGPNEATKDTAVCGAEESRNIIDKVELLQLADGNCKGNVDDVINQCGPSNEAIIKPCYVVLNRHEIDAYFNGKEDGIQNQTDPPYEEQQQPDENMASILRRNGEDEITPQHNENNNKTKHCQKWNITIDLTDECTQRPTITWSPTELINSDDERSENHTQTTSIPDYILEEDRSTIWSPTEFVEPSEVDGAMLKSCLSTKTKAPNGNGKTISFNPMVKVFEMSPQSTAGDGVNGTPTHDSNSLMPSYENDDQENPTVSPIDDFIKPNNGEKSREREEQEDCNPKPTNFGTLSTTEKQHQHYLEIETSSNSTNISHKDSETTGRDYVSCAESPQAVLGSHQYGYPYVHQEIEVQTPSQATEHINSPQPVYLFSQEEMLQFTSVDSLHVSSTCATNTNPTLELTKNLQKPMMSPSEQEVTSSQDQTPLSGSLKEGGLHKSPTSGGDLQNNQVDTTNNLPELIPAPTLDSYIASSTIDIAALGLNDKEKPNSPPLTKKDATAKNVEKSTKGNDENPHKLLGLVTGERNKVDSETKDKAKDNKFKIPKIKRDFNERSNLASSLAQKEVNSKPSTTSGFKQNPFVTRNAAACEYSKKKPQMETSHKKDSNHPSFSSTTESKTQVKQKREHPSTPSDTVGQNKTSKPVKLDSKTGKRERSTTPSDNEIRRRERKTTAEAKQLNDKTKDSDDENKLHKNVKTASKRERSATPSDSETQKRPKRKITEVATQQQKNAKVGDASIEDKSEVYAIPIKSHNNPRKEEETMNADKRERSVTPTTDSEQKRPKRKVTEIQQEKSASGKKTSLKTDEIVSNDTKPNKDNKKVTNSKQKLSKTKFSSKEGKHNSKEKTLQSSSLLPAAYKNKDTKTQSDVPQPPNKEKPQVATEISSIPSSNFYPKDSNKATHKSHGEKSKHLKFQKAEARVNTSVKPKSGTNVDKESSRTTETTLLTTTPSSTAPISSLNSITNGDSHVRKKQKLK
ncbi:uncharacterized protein isoform X2 [Musca autumnalis]|uniref:uncharacterized protein isoform X2 n=1 Tax=Musca autumnalis TaxID=221902 RepID=UPI003CF0D8B2